MSDKSLIERSKVIDWGLFMGIIMSTSESEAEYLQDTRKHIKNLTAELTRLQEQSEWISFEDSQPKVGETVLFRIAYQTMEGGHYSETDQIITGGIDSDGELWVGNKRLIWDYAYNLDFSEEDITGWRSTPSEDSK